MVKQKTYNTALIAIDKKGNKIQYSSLEEASKATGLAERTIKSRAVNQGKTGKDGTIFEWIDETTKRAFKAKQSKKKGNSFELQIVNDLKEIGYEGVCSSRSQNKLLDAAKIDIADTNNELPVYIQAKHLAVYPNYHKIEEDCPLKDKPFIIAYKKAFNDGTRSPEPLAIMPLKYFYQLISKK